MATGLPDYLRGVDVAAQALAEIVVRPQNIPRTDVDVTAQTLGQLINRPKYGGAIRTIGSIVATPNSLETIVTISGKGMIYGGITNVVTGSDQGNSIVILNVDSNTLMGMSFKDLNYYCLYNPLCTPIIVLRYDNAGYKYTVGLAYGITFETSLTVQYYEKHGTGPSVTSRLFYALI